MIKKDDEIKSTTWLDPANKATIVIFLDIKGVIFYNPLDANKVQKRAIERFTGTAQELPILYPSVEGDKAAVDLFDHRTLDCLNKLILQINNTLTTTAAIFVYSTWCPNRTVADVTALFKQHVFAQYIVDQAPPLSSPLSSKEITKRLLANRHHYNVCGSLILDDDSGLSADFATQFVADKHRTLWRNSEYKLALSIVDQILQQPTYFIKPHKQLIC